MKKTLAILLTLALVLCMVPGTAFATTLAEGETVSSVAVADIAAQTYTGSAITPEPVVTAVITVPAATAGAQPTTKTVTLVKGTDYDVSYNNNINKGTATATVTFKAETPFAGRDAIAKNFEIGALDLSSASIKIEEGSAPITTVDNAKTNVVVKLNGSVITEGFDITAAESSSDKTTVLVTITAKEGGNFTGSKTAAFYKRTTFDSTYAVTAGTLTYTGSTLTPSLSFTKDGKYISLVAGTDYTVAYDNLVNAGLRTITVTGIGKYTGEIKGSFTINQRSITNATLTVPNVAQNGTVAPVVKDGTKTLVYGTDYTYTPQNTSVVGNKTLTITGIGNYTGTLNANYTVIDSNKVFNTTHVTFGSATPYYSGSYQYKDITVKIGNTTLRKDVDYKVEYTRTVGTVTTTNSYALDAGTYNVTVTGIGAYSGTVTGTFKILQIPLDYVTVTASAGYTTTKPNVVVKSIVNGVVFKETTDYTVYSWNSTYTNKTYVTVTSTGTGNLAAGNPLEAEFSMVGKNLAYCTAEFATGSKQYNNYTGSAIKPTVRVRDGYTVLTAGSDYTVTYKDAAGKVVAAPKDAGTYTIEITGKGAYSGTLTLYYYINGTDISSYTVTLKADSVKADGLAKTPVISSVKYGFYSTLSSADYTVTYEDYLGNAVTAYSIKTPGTYKVIVTGKGGYTGSTYAYFTVVGTPQEIKIDKTSYKVYKDSDSFTIKPTATGDGTGFSFVSSDPSVATVSAKGVVTIHKLGRAKITVTTTGMKKSDPASDDVFVKVYPDKGQLTQKPWTEGKKASMRVRWEKQDDVTYYEVRYSRKSDFRSGSYKTKKVTASTLNYDTQSTSITGLKSGYKYYVKVRAVKEVKNDYGQTLKYYGKWSNWRSVNVK